MTVCKVLVLGVLSALVFGCLSPRTDGMAVENARLQIDNVPFSLNLKMVQDAMHRTEEGFLRVQVAVRNENRQDFDCQYRFIWKDKDGLIMTHAKSVWLPLVLHGKQETVVEGVSPVLGAADFKLVLRGTGLK
jgi:uncharacterized protein YcfL